MTSVGLELRLDIDDELELVECTLNSEHDAVSFKDGLVYEIWFIELDDK